MAEPHRVRRAEALATSWPPMPCWNNRKSEPPLRVAVLVPVKVIASPLPATVDSALLRMIAPLEPLTRIPGAACAERLAAFPCFQRIDRVIAATTEACAR